MLVPSTNWRPISRMALPAPMRTTGSPRFLNMFFSIAPVPPDLGGASSWPVIKSATVDELTRAEEERPKCERHCPETILSSISSSTVEASGTLSKLSARVISAMPSLVSSPYSAKKASMRPGLNPSLTCLISLVASSTMAARSWALGASLAISCLSAASSLTSRWERICVLRSLRGAELVGVIAWFMAVAYAFKQLISVATGRIPCQ